MHGTAYITRNFETNYYYPETSRIILYQSSQKYYGKGGLKSEIERISVFEYRKGCKKYAVATKFSHKAQITDGNSPDYVVKFHGSILC